MLGLCIPAQLSLHTSSRNLAEPNQGILELCHLMPMEIRGANFLSGNASTEAHVYKQRILLGKQQGLGKRMTLQQVIICNHTGEALPLEPPMTQLGCGLLKLVFFQVKS